MYGSGMVTSDLSTDMHPEGAGSYYLGNSNFFLTLHFFPTKFGFPTI